MNRIVKTIVLVLLPLLGVACAGGGERADSEAAVQAPAIDAPIKGGSATLVVYGMSCPLCANNVDKALMDVPGVTAVALDMGTGRASVSLDSKAPPTRRMLETAVRNSGFTLKSVEVP